MGPFSMCHVVFADERAIPYKSTTGPSKKLPFAVRRFLRPTAFYVEMENYGWVQNSIGQRHNFVPCPQPTLPTTSDEQLQTPR